MLLAAQDGGRRALMLAVLIVGLLAGLVAMHHVSAAEPHGTVVPGNGAEPAHATVADIGVGMQRDGVLPPTSDHGDTGFLHLCLAILTGVALVIATQLKWRTGMTPAARPPVRSIRPVPAPRSPPPSAPARLALLCVLRT